MGNATESTPFKLNQRIVYPLHGVGMIREIFERTWKGNPTLYYSIYLSVNDMTMMVPVEKAEEQGIRAIVEQKYAKDALEIVGNEYEPIAGDWKMRYQTNRELLKHGEVTDIAKVVQNLYHRSKIKELPIMERKLFDSALKLLVDEVGFSLGLPVEEVEQMIFSRLESEKEEKKPRE
jgi:CarD family transcriptional regulator